MQFIIQTTDNDLISLSQKMVSTSEVLRTMIDDIKPTTEKQIIQLKINSSILKRIMTLCEQSYDVLKTLNLDELIEILYWLNFFDIGSPIINAVNDIIVIMLKTMITNKSVSNTTLFNTLPWNMRENIYKKLEYNEIKKISELFNDINCQYSLKLMDEEMITSKYATIIKDSKKYEKLFAECSLIKKIPKLEHVIIAGGFVNIALDDNLHYDDFPNSDIDIFVCGKDHMDEFEKILQFFEGLHAKYKMFNGIVNVYIENYKRNFQIICHENYENVYSCISNFHSSNLKCGYYNNQLIMMPDCAYTLQNKIAFINNYNINAFTLQKTIKRGYVPMDYTLDLNNIETYLSIKNHNELNQRIIESEYVTYKKVLQDVKPIQFCTYTGKSDLGEIYTFDDSRLTIISTEAYPITDIYACYDGNVSFKTEKLGLENLVMQKSTEFPIFRRLRFREITLQICDETFLNKSYVTLPELVNAYPNFKIVKERIYKSIRTLNIKNPLCVFDDLYTKSYLDCTYNDENDNITSWISGNTLDTTTNKHLKIVCGIRICRTLIQCRQKHEIRVFIKKINDENFIHELTETVLYNDKNRDVHVIITKTEPYMPFMVYISSRNLIGIRYTIKYDATKEGIYINDTFYKMPHQELSSTLFGDN